MATTYHLDVRYIEQSQAQKEVTVNEALSRMDAVLNVGAMDCDVGMPPASPAGGDVYLVGENATGEWAGFDHHIAYFDQIWRFIAPLGGSAIWVRSRSRFYIYDGDAARWRAAQDHPMISMPAAMMVPALSNGCGTLERRALGSNKPDVSFLAFDAAQAEYAMCDLMLPHYWNHEALYVEFFWSHRIAASGDVVWGCDALAVDDMASLNQSYSASATVIDSGGTVDQLYRTVRSGAIIPAGFVGDTQHLSLRISRQANDAADTLTTDALLHGIAIYSGASS